MPTTDYKHQPFRIIATPGRLLHLQVEMSLSLSAIQYLVFDEADRLFELGFATHLTNILSSLPTARQTLLFSATLPKSLVEFAKAGLREPKLVRLDSEMKISSDLRMSFWWVKEGEKTAGLLSLLRDVIGVPLEADLPRANAKSDAQSKGSKSKKGDGTGAAVLAPHQSLIFVSTQHHVHYLSTLLSQVGYAVSAIHGNLTQSARTFALSTFSQNQTSIMVTTDVAARGIDIPILENVINYDFPIGNRVFVHRVGRTARMGRRGWAWNFVTREELPYLLDLQLFLGRPLVNSVPELSESSFVDSLILGPFPRDVLDQDLEYIRNLEDKNYELVSLKGVMERGSKMYNRTKGKASPVSYGRAKEFNKERSREGGEVVNPAWILRTDGTTRMTGKDTPKGSKSNGPTNGKSREELLKTLASFKPSETVFEIGSRGKTAGALLMKERRRALSKSASRTAISLVEKNEESTEDNEGDGVDIEMANEEEIMVRVRSLNELFLTILFCVEYLRVDPCIEGKGPREIDDFQRRGILHVSLSEGCRN
jgi:ATP-dependent RNA helicase DDX54/DBP10